MANPQWRLLVSIRDNKKNESVITLYPTGADYDAAYANANILLTNLQPLTLGVIAKAELVSLLTDSGAQAAAGVDNEEGVLFTYDDEDGKAVQIRIPAVNETIFLPNTGTVNSTNASVVTWNGNITGGLVTGSRSQAIASYRNGFENFSKARKRKG